MVDLCSYFHRWWDRMQVKELRKPTKANPRSRRIGPASSQVGSKAGMTNH